MLIKVTQNPTIIITNSIWYPSYWRAAITAFLNVRLYDKRKKSSGLHKDYVAILILVKSGHRCFGLANLGIWPLVQLIN